jgi:transposase
MARRIQLAAHLSVEELGRRYRLATDPVERSRWHMLWLLGQGQTAQQVAAVTGYSAYWIGQIAQCYNRQGPVGVSNRWHQARGHAPAIPLVLQEELRQVLTGPPSAEDKWTGRTEAEWLTARVGRLVPYHLGWRYLRRLGLRRYAPRPRHVQGAEPAEREAYKEFILDVNQQAPASAG